VRAITVVGASLAGLRSAQALREHGFDGRLTVVGTEAEMPYDRPPLSKAFLSGDATEQDLALALPEDLDALAVEWLLGSTATRLRPGSREVELHDGRTLLTDGIVVATGARPVMLPESGGLQGLFTLRTLADARALRTALSAGSPRVAVVGAGFIGAEVASTCRSLGLEVTVVEAMPEPLAPILGTELAAACSSLHLEHGVCLLAGHPVRRLLADNGRVHGVELVDGQHVVADVVVVGIGVRPNCEWLADSGVTIDNGVVCDAGGVTTIPEVVAVGDVASHWSPARNARIRVEHWASAMEQPGAAIENLLAGHTVRSVSDVPYFWSEQYGVRIQFAGHRLPGAAHRIVDGDLADRRWTAVYEVHGQTVAVLAMNQPRTFTRLRRGLIDRQPVPASQ
jgi:3-phenylpropionate/trans-cinnamate dioxygenase ferredoxin reductase subunit